MKNNKLINGVQEKIWSLFLTSVKAIIYLGELERKKLYNFSSNFVSFSEINFLVSY